jgi:thiol:disulfide interchange protein DsbD
MMGCLLLAVAAYFAGQRLIHGEGFWWLVFAAIVASAVFLIVRTAQLMPRVRPLSISVGLALLTAGVAFVATLRLADDRQMWVPYTESALVEARRSGKPVVVKFTANWCANCQYVEASVFHDEATLKELRRRGVRMIKADLTSSTAPGWVLLKSLNPSGGIPLTAVYLPGHEQPIRLESIYTSSTLMSALDENSTGFADVR